MFDFERYFREERQYLANLGREFAEVHPDLAPRLGAAASDPDVERLLDGFAFLTARIRERLDQGNAEIAEQLATLVAPHLVRSIPACSIIELKPQRKSLTARHLVPRGSEVDSVALQGTQCRYRTTADIELLPARVSQTRLEEPRADHGARAGRLVLTLELDEGGAEALVAPGGLRLFVAERDRSVATTLVRWLLNCTSGIRVRDPASNDEVTLGDARVRHLGLGADEALLPWPRESQPGFRLLQELTVFPDKFNFIMLEGLEGARDVVRGRSVEIIFELDLSGESRLATPVSQDALRMHCVPVANLFKASVAMSVEAADESRILRPDGISPEHVEVFSVDKVSTREPGGQETRVYDDYYSFRHMSQRSGAFYSLQRVTSTRDGRPDLYLRLSSTRDRTPSVRRQVLSVEMTCTNRALPLERPEGGTIRVPVAGGFGVATFENITRISAPLPPQLGSEQQWRFLAFLLANQRSLANIEVLKSMLYVHSSRRRSEAQANRIEALEASRTAPARRTMFGSPVRGQRTEIVVREGGFEGLGDVFVFGSVLDELFASQVAVNAFHELHIVTKPSGRRLQWAPRAGRRPLL